MGKRPFLLAASAAIIFIAAATILWLHSASFPVYATAVGEQRSLRLPDGSTVNLNSRSQIEVLFMSRGNVTANGRTYGEKTAIELLPSDGPVDIKANEESLFFTVTLPKL